MEIIFRAIDGKTFKKREDCEVYEKKISRMVRMYDDLGLTTDSSRALVTVLTEDESALAFKNICHNQGSYSDGINAEDKGVFLWADDKYIPLDDIQLNGLRQYFKSEGGE